MSWDIKYRPVRYSDVLDQDKTVSVLRQTVKEGKGFHSSYLFAGLHGGGKTTLARILARSLLCSNPQDGEPCDECGSCRDILNTGRSETFVEIDAATNSGKDDIRKILEDVDFATFSGKRRIYLLDESHQLSKDALDALLKPIEDVIPGTEDRKLVCLFCTTEPEKMRATIGSRCGPTFTIKVASPEAIADRLLWILQQEGEDAEREALVHIAEGVDGHIRDAIRAVEMLALGGKITQEQVIEFLGHNLNPTYLNLLRNLRENLTVALSSLDTLMLSQSPGEIYNKLASVCLLAYKSSVGVRPKNSSYWDSEALSQVGSDYGRYLLEMSEAFSLRPRLPTRDMIECDLASLSVRLNTGSDVSLIQKSAPSLTQVGVSSVVLERIKEGLQPLDSKVEITSEVEEPAQKKDISVSGHEVVVTNDGQVCDPRFVNPKAMGLLKSDPNPDPLVNFVSLVQRNLSALQTGGSASSHASTSSVEEVSRETSDKEKEQPPDS